ncbi:DUF6221 family protein [Streptomyces sp. NPDC058621]|uniref:DUF6221 family protein n=1 Tax=Streptomyces sp. NPDC058621 TaxID=3346561 RepID=UPI00364BAAAD
MDDLVQFLRDRYDEDVVEAGKLADGDDWEMEPWQVRRDETGTYDSYAYLRIAKARVLAEVDAKRRILLLHNIPGVVSPKMASFGLREGEAPEDDRRCAGCGLDYMDDPITPDVSECPILRALALPYADHPDYREDWRPTST